MHYAMNYLMCYATHYVMHVHVHVTCGRLHAVVERVGDDDAAVTRHCQAFGAIELALLAALAADAVAAAQARIVAVAQPPPHRARRARQLAEKHLRT